eukprot:TRINITY_DN6202_c0_g1_i1.p1 TRINITY_DN6202_c0_g1~~TRINITY_DN6202_c0_g1_i1.p1  ORF type:complete len:242 (-),score=36.15 TRINITY_DN6202_c0_g1_i1:69-737(-)
MRALFGGVTSRVVLYLSTDDAFSAVINNATMIAVLADWTPVYPPEIASFPINYITPSCSFYRKDYVSSCGDTIVDTQLGEECETGGLGCIDCTCTYLFKPSPSPSIDCKEACGDGVVDVEFNEDCDGGVGCNSTLCTCLPGYIPSIPISTSCQKKPVSLAVILGVTLSTLGVLLLVGIILLALLFPYFRAKYIKEGQLKQRFALFRTRTGVKTAAPTAPKAN